MNSRLSNIELVSRLCAFLELSMFVVFELSYFLPSQEKGDELDNGMEEPQGKKSEHVQSVASYCYSTPVVTVKMKIRYSIF